MLDRQSQTTMKLSIAQGAHAATVHGTGVDLSNCDSATVYFAVETVTDGTHTPSIEDSPDNSTWTAVPAANLIPAATPLVALASNVYQKQGYVGIQRYLRASVTVSGATTGGVYTAQIILGAAKKLPQAT